MGRTTAPSASAGAALPRGGQRFGLAPHGLWPPDHASFSESCHLSGPCLLRELDKNRPNSPPPHPAPAPRSCLWGTRHPSSPRGRPLQKLSPPTCSDRRRPGTFPTCSGRPAILGMGTPPHGWEPAALSVRASHTLASEAPRRTVGFR